MTMSTRTRRATALLAGVLSAALLLTACGTGNDPGDVDTPAASSEGFPVTVDAAYGEITIPKKPERIVVVSGAYVGMLDVLDEEPVAYYLSFVSSAEEIPTVQPWLSDIDGAGLDTSLVTAEYKVNAEAVAAYEPDLILGDFWQIDEQMYERLSQIAPTYAGVEKEAIMAQTWEDVMASVGSMTGKSTEASQAIAGLDAAYESARTQLAGLQGKTYGGGALLGGEFVNTNTRDPFFEELGLVHSENAPETVSWENLDQFTADVLFFAFLDGPDDQEKLESDPRFLDLPASKNGTVFITDMPTRAAGVDINTLSEAWKLNSAVQLLKDTALNTAAQ